MRVAVLGSGAAGLLSAQALTELGVKHELFDRNVPSYGRPVRGLHYLHDACGLEIDPAIIHNVIIGNDPGVLPADQYASKLGTTAKNSLVSLPAYTVAYSFPQAMELLVRRHGHKVTELTVTPSILNAMLARFDYIINTVPLQTIYPEAVCESVVVSGTQGTPEGIGDLGPLGHEHQVVYNLDANDNWYRYSRIFGREWSELLSGGDYPIMKVLDTDFSSPNERIILMGRYGSWKRSYLSHNAYYDTMEAFG